MIYLARPRRSTLPINSRPQYGVTKYGNTGLFSAISFKGNITLEWKNYLAGIANHSLSKQTWSSYKTAGTMLEKCQDETNHSMHLPLNDEKVLTFVAWLLNRNLSSRTISTYLSGLRQVHLAKGIPIPTLRPDLIKQILTGATNLDQIKKRNAQKPTRLPVTITVMKLLKLEIKNGEESKENKRLLWSVATLCFNGAFRIHELLSRTSRQFDPNFTLLTQDVKIKVLNISGERVKTIQVKLKSPKTDRIGTGTIVDVYESKGPLCPIRAFEKWQSSASRQKNKYPLFINDQGVPLTGKKIQLLPDQIPFTLPGLQERENNIPLLQSRNSLPIRFTRLCRKRNSSSRQMEQPRLPGLPKTTQNSTPNHGKNHWTNESLNRIYITICSINSQF